MKTGKVSGKESGKESGKQPGPADDASASVNEVRVVGRLSRDPERRALPSGDEVWTFLVVVPRPPGGRSRQTVDTLDCAVWGGRVKGAVSTWATGDVVEVTGSVRRRFFKTGGGPASRVEIEVASGRIIRRASAPRRGGTG